MRLLIKQRVFSWTDTFDIYDEAGNPKYFVKGEFFSLGASAARIRCIRAGDRLGAGEAGAAAGV